jgi:hypothetical protein
MRPVFLGDEQEKGQEGLAQVLGTKGLIRSGWKRRIFRLALICGLS